MRVSFFFRWYDLWIGAYIDRDNRTLYVCPLPTIGVRITFESLCFPRRHKWSGWIENLGRYSTVKRFRQCERCMKVELGDE